MTTQQRKERIAEHYAFREGEKSRIIAALTAFAEEQEKWLPISSAPEYVDGIELERVLVYSTDFGITIGRVCKWPDGTFTRRVEGQCGDWNITHFAPLPPAPSTGEKPE